MKKTIMIGERALDLCANAATPIRFKMTFGRDLLKGLSGLETDYEELSDIVPEMAYIMNAQATEDIDSLSFDDYLKWLEDFDDPMGLVMASSDIISFYLQNVKTSSKPKNAKGPRSGK